VYNGVTPPIGVVSAQHSEEEDGTPQRNFTIEEIKTGNTSPATPAVMEEKPAAVPEPKSAVAAPSAAASSPDHSNDRYFVIAGAFGVESNAEAMVEKLHRQGFAGARIVPSASHKLTLVCYGGAATRSGANGLLDSLRTAGRDGWVLAQ
jgi:cell division septation protein DedD